MTGTRLPDRAEGIRRTARLLDWLHEGSGNYSGLLFDIDGTLVRGGGALSGAAELLDWLAAKGVPHLLVTNDANHSHEEKSEALSRAGLELSPEWIVSAGDVVATAASEHRLAGRTVFVMGSLGKPDYAEKAGISVTRELARLDECAGVIVGEENYDWQSTFNAVINFFIKHPTAPFIVPNPDIYWPSEGGGIAIGAGGKAGFIVSVLEDYGVHIRPEYLGKPHGAIFESARSRISELCGAGEVPSERIIMVGDSLKGDIRGANRAGFFSVLVLTGITVEAQLERSFGNPDLRPRLIAEAL